ncbi:MAG: ATP-binding protein [Acidimicrobiales bacterium]
MKELRTAFPADARSPGAARRFVAETLRALGLAYVTEVACLLTSELVTNAVIHAGSPVDLVVAVDDGRVRIEVHDRLDRLLPPDCVPAAAEAIGGRGLQLVSALSDAWGVVHDGTGKAVWFSLAT